MVKIDNINNIKYSVFLIENICELLEEVYGLEEFNVTDTDNKSVNIVPYDSACALQISNINDNNFSVNVTIDSNVIYSVDSIDIIKLRTILMDIKIYGISYNDDCFDFIIGEKIEATTSVTDTDDEAVEESSIGGKFSGESMYKKPIIFGEITQLRVVPLKFNGIVIAYRFKTNLGAFDMSRSVAERYGLGSIKSDKFIPLENINGIYMSSTEKKLHQLVPEVSECDEDCTKLINAVFGD